MEKNTLDKQLIGTLTVRGVITFVLSILAFAAISWIYFYPSDVNGDVLQQNDVLQGAANGQEAKLYNESHDGEVTRWTNSLFGGMPTFQIAPSYKSNSIINTIGKVLTLGFPEPVSWIFLLMLGFFILMISFKVKWYLAVLGAIGYAFSSYFFIIIDAGHIWKLLTLCYIPPTIAGIVWAYRGKYLLGAAVAALFATLQLISNHVQMTYYSLLIIVPLVIAFLVIAIKDKKLGQWCIATCSLAVAAALALGANASNLYMSYKYSQETMRGGHSELTPLPAEPGQEPAVSSEPTGGGLSKEYITQWSYGIGETWTLMVPNVKGGSSMKTLADVDGADDMAAESELGTQVLPAFPQYFGDQPFTSGPVYVGALIFALFVLSIFVVKGPVKWALLVATIMSILLSWGHNFMGLTDFFIDHIPMYNKFRTVSSILVVAEFTIPLMAVLALKQIFTQEDYFKKHGTLTYAVFGACALLCVIFAVSPGMFGGAPSADEAERINQALQGQATLDQLPGVTAAVETIRHSLVSSDAWRSLVVIVLGFVVLMAYRFNKLNSMATGLAIAAIVLVDMYTINKRYLNQERFVSRDDLPEATFEKTAADAKILADKDPNYRVLDLPGFGQPRSSYFHKAVGGYHAAKLTRYNDLIERSLTPSLEALITEINERHTIDSIPPVFNMLNAKYFMLGDREDDVFVNDQALGNAWFVDSITYVNTADDEMLKLNNLDPATAAVADAKFKGTLGMPKAKQPGDTIYETSYAPNKLTYKAHSAQGGLAVFSEIYFPWGWKATIDGKEANLGRVNYVLRAMQLPAGDHTIEMTFDPDEVHNTESIAKIACGLIFLLLLAALGYEVVRSRRSKRNDPQDEQETKK